MLTQISVGTVRYPNALTQLFQCGHRAVPKCPHKIIPVWAPCGTQMPSQNYPSVGTVRYPNALTKLSQCGHRAEPKCPHKIIPVWAPCGTQMPSQNYRNRKWSTWVSEKEKSVQGPGGHARLCLGFVNYYVGLFVWIQHYKDQTYFWMLLPKMYFSLQMARRPNTPSSLRMNKNYQPSFTLTKLTVMFKADKC
jgi:hypothetical protein